jgi:hypothetical protein
VQLLELTRESFDIGLLLRHVLTLRVVLSVDRVRRRLSRIHSEIGGDFYERALHRSD